MYVCIVGWFVVGCLGFGSVVVWWLLFYVDDF